MSHLARPVPASIPGHPSSPPTPAAMPPMLVPKLFYFFIFAALAALFPFLPLYYGQIGLTGSQIGLLTGLPPLVMLFSAPLFGAIADATRRHKLLLMLSMVGWMVMVLVLSQLTWLIYLLPAVVLYALFFAPILPLADHSVLDSLGKYKHRYGRQRLWGSIGWGASAPLVGVLVQGAGLHWSFNVCIMMALILLLVTIWLPVSRAPVHGHFWRGLRLLTNRRWAVLLMIGFVGGAALSVVNNYLFLYMAELGAGGVVMGLSMTIGTVSEMFIMFYADRLLAGRSAGRLLAISLFFMVVRLLAYSWAGSAGWVLAIQLLHGPTFGLMWIAGVSHADHLAPAGMGATAQGLFSGISMGLGAAFGSVVGGMSYQAVGLALTFQWAGMVVLAALVFYLMMLWRKPDA
jgi:PPP family 3-phenylpropionic acid transporter